MSQKYPLDGLALEIKEHWAAHRPKMYRALEQAGQLDQALHQASERTGQAFAELVEQGREPPRAGEAVREEWAVLPSEADEPSLPSRAPSPPPESLFPESPPAS